MCGCSMLPDRRGYHNPRAMLQDKLSDVNANHSAPETYHGRILERPVSQIRPSPENELIYHRLDRQDPDQIALAQSIRIHGLKEPIVITEDNYILSGHRRHLAHQMIGKKTILCRVEPIRRGDPEFLPLLPEFNRQRVKSIDEVAREAAMNVDPEDAHRMLVEHRKKKSQLQIADTVAMGSRRSRSRISDAKEPMLDAIDAILSRLRDFWPLTVRQVHYQLLNDPPLVHASKPGSTYRNDKSSYNAVKDLLARARLEGRFPWESIHDPTRSVVVWTVDKTPGPFIRRELDDFLKGFYRDLQQSQPNHVEIVGEKNTVDSIIRPVAMEYCIPMTIGRGYSSTPPRKAIADRFRRSGKDKLVLIFLSDFDPEGEDIPTSFSHSMRDDFGVTKIVPVKSSLTDKQVRALNLHPNMDAREKADGSRYKEFSKKHGDSVHELEAVEPEQLQTMLRETIDSVLDLDAFNAEIELEKQNEAQLEGLRRTILKMVSPVLDRLK